MFSFKSVVAATVLATVAVSSAFAADTGALKAGKPAGVKKAQFATSDFVVGAGLAAIAVATAIVVSDQNSKAVTAPTATVSP